MTSNTHREPVSRAVHPDDQMYNTGPDWYFAVGESGLAAVLHAAAAAAIKSVRSVLDLPCGHGRVGRYLRAAFPDAEFTFCDIDRGGADFCSATFGGRALYSEPDLAQVSFEPVHDVIWIGSLFTHVNVDRTRRWLRHLCQNALSPGGVLVATFHGRRTVEIRQATPLIDPDSWAKVIAGYEADGYGYADYPDPPGQVYGISLCRPSKVVGIAESIPGVRIASFGERAWADHHDVLALAKPSAAAAGAASV